MRPAGGRDRGQAYRAIRRVNEPICWPSGGVFRVPRRVVFRSTPMSNPQIFLLSLIALAWGAVFYAIWQVVRPRK